MFVDLPAPTGRIEALLWDVPRPFAAAVVCHPHPLQGGSMHSHVPYRVARAVRDSGAVALRFNFRGVGRSSGNHDEGRGEMEDVKLALDHLESLHPGVPLWVAGFSFGAWVGLRHGQSDARVKALLGVGLPLNSFDFSFLPELSKPLAVIQGERDEFGPSAEVEPLLSRMAAPHQLFSVAGASHLFDVQLDALEAQTRQAITFLRQS
jgi:alpha/beta superfamily hydrolase